MDITVELKEIKELLRIHKRINSYITDNYNISECLNKVDALLKHIEVVEQDNKRAVLLGVEFGYKQCEKGDNIQATLQAARELLTKEGE